jgi:hypothetical protein
VWRRGERRGEQSASGRADWLDLGGGTHVLRDEVVGLCGAPAALAHLNPAEGGAPHLEGVRAVVILRNGRLVPAYVSPATLRKHLFDRPRRSTWPDLDRDA